VQEAQGRGSAPEAGDQVRLKPAQNSCLLIDDKLLADVHRNMGQVYMDRRRWRKASIYFVMSKQMDKLVECLFHMGDLSTLRELRSHLPENSLVHKQLAGKYESIGLCEEAVDCYVKVRLTSARTHGLGAIVRTGQLVMNR
jgi:hypothetical protein